MTTTEAVITTINTESRLTTTQSSTVSSTIATTRTVPNGNAVFVLNSYSSSNRPMVVDFEGKNVDRTDSNKYDVDFKMSNNKKGIIIWS